ncbi:hypothetical protein GQ457_17G003650 [Hibiscus cannabinus]
MSKVRVIDFSKQDLLQPGSLEWNTVRVQVRRVLEDYGCFEASIDRLLELRRAVFGATEELFNLPLPTKKLCVSESRFCGCMGWHHHRDCMKACRSTMLILLETLNNTSLTSCGLRET